MGVSLSLLISTVGVREQEVITVLSQISNEMPAIIYLDHDCHVEPEDTTRVVFASEDSINK